MENIVDFLKKIRKQNNLKKHYSSKYAFVGIGNHSLNNLYPVLDYLKVPLKYIVVKSQSTADLINENYSSVKGTTDYDAVLADEEINGILISASPASHYVLVKKALAAGKNVFVEKPPCTTVDELDDLTASEKESGKTCVAGLQKRYSECIALLKKELKAADIISYNYRFVVGAYPDGDPYWDLFIHPVDLISYMFGNTKLLSVHKTESSKGQTSVFMHAVHDKIIGSVEMSTQYAWNMPDEELMINTTKGVYTMKNHQTLTYQPKPGMIFSLPKEKIFPSVPQTQYLFNGNNFLPVFENNQLVSQGFFSEIKTFIDICEGRKVKNNSGLSSLKQTFNLIAEIK